MKLQVDLDDISSELGLASSSELELQIDRLETTIEIVLSLPRL